MRLAAEPLPVAAVGGEVLGEDFERHGALVLGVERAVDLAHPAAADELLDPVGTELPQLHPWPPAAVAGV